MLRYIYMSDQVEETVEGGEDGGRGEVFWACQLELVCDNGGEESMEAEGGSSEVW